jgi:glutaredoxin-like protein NrdH
LVIVISSPGCQPCRISKEVLKSRGIDFVERNIAEDPEALELAKSLGYSSSPVIIDGDTHWSGLDRDKLLAIAA